MSKICIFSPGRSGSNLLISSLSNHPDIKPAHGPDILAFIVTSSMIFYSDFIKKEFNIDIKKYEKLSYFNQTVIMQELLLKLISTEYIDFIFKHQDICKILYCVICQKNNFIIDYFKKHKDIFIINLSRKNLLDQFLSTKSINELMNIKSESQEKMFFQLIKNDIDFIIKYERIIDSVFSDRVIKIYYEDLIEYWDDIIYDIEEKCNLKKIKLDKSTKKQTLYSIEKEKSKIDPKLIKELKKIYSEYII